MNLNYAELERRLHAIVTARAKVSVFNTGEIPRDIPLQEIIYSGACVVGTPYCADIRGLMRVMYPGTSRGGPIFFKGTHTYRGDLTASGPVFESVFVSRAYGINVSMLGWTFNETLAVLWQDYLLYHFPHLISYVDVPQN